MPLASHPPHPASLRRSHWVGVVAACRPNAAWNAAQEPIEPPAAVYCVLPLYPQSLREAGIEGSSVVRVAFDSAGVPDSASIHFVRVTADEIELGVREAIPHVRLVPRGTGERIVVEFTHQFSLARD